MMFKLLCFTFTALSCFPFAFAVARTDDDDLIKAHPWMAPGANDVRGPCPALNTLANHGYIPHSGKGLTINNLITGIKDGLNVDQTLTVPIAKLSLLTSPNASDSFTLVDIRLRNNIEHDVSLSRQDLFLGDNFSFNETIYKTLADSNPGSDYYNATSAGEVQRLRLIDSQARNPTLINTEKEFGDRTRESALYLMVIGNASTGVAPKKYVNIFFREERLPFEEGWTKSPIEINPTNLATISAQIAAASDWKANSSQTPSLSMQLSPGVFVTE